MLLDNNRNTGNTQNWLSVNNHSQNKVMSVNVRNKVHSQVSIDKNVVNSQANLDSQNSRVKTVINLDLVKQLKVNKIFTEEPNSSIKHFKVNLKLKEELYLFFTKPLKWRMR